MMTARTLSGVLSGLALVSSAAAQCGGWTAEASIGPGPRESTDGDWDPIHNVAILHGGGLQNPPYTSCTDTWEWNGAAWTRKATTGPSFRSYAKSAYDPIRQKLVYFGGFSNETWLWDGAAWSQFIGAAPPARDSHAMAFDPVHGVIVVHGGNGASGPTGDTWTFDGAAWTLASASGPRMFGFADMFFDVRRNAIVLLGTGADAPGGLQLWEWSGAAWSPIDISAGPIPSMLGRGARFAGDYNAGAYDLARNVFVVYHDDLSGGTSTWEWDGETFYNVHATLPIPGFRMYAYAAYDGNLGRVILNGGRRIDADPTDATWGLRPVPARIDQQPQGGLVYANAALALRVHPGGSAPFTYQWRRNGVPLSNGGRISGADGRILRIDSAVPADSGTFDCIVSNACGQAATVLSPVTVLACPPDINHDGLLDFFDYDDFVSDFETAGPRADYNQDGFLDFFDYDAFVVDFQAGC